MALLDIRNLNIEIQTPNGRIKIVDGVNLSLNEGEILGLVGESGSGKSLIAKVISNSIKDNWIVTADRFRFRPKSKNRQTAYPKYSQLDL